MLLLKLGLEYEGKMKNNSPENTVEILELEKIGKRAELNLKYAESGVEFVDIRTAYIDENVKIGKGTKIYPNVIIEGNTVIGENSIIGANSQINNSQIGNSVNIKNSVLEDSKVGDGTSVGPFAYLRPKSDIGNNCKIGDFVEVKNSVIGDGSKASHLTYIGDSDIGKDVNLGCGVVFVNYDGVNKHRSMIEDGAFIGCNVNLVSPVTVGKEGYVAAGSTVTQNVPEGALFVAREKGKLIEGWVDRIIKKRKERKNENK